MRAVMKLCRLWLCCLLPATLAAEPAQQKKLQVLVGMHKPPYIIQHSNSGYELDLIRLSAAAAGLKVRFVYVPNGRLLSEMKSGRFDLALLPETSAQAHHRTDALNCYHDVIVRASAQQARAANWASLFSQRVYAFQGASQILGANFVATVPKMREYQELADQRAQVEALFKDRVDAIVLDQRIFHYYRRQLKQDSGYQLTPILHRSCYVLASSSESLAATLSKQLTLLRQSDTHQQLVPHYFAE